MPLQVRIVVQRRRGHLDRARGGLDARACRCAAPPWSRDEARVAIDGVPDQPGVSHRVFAAIADAEHRRGHDRPERRHATAGRPSASPCPTNELPATLARAAARWPPSWGAASSTTSEVSKVSIVGTGMRTHTGVAEQMFAALAGREHQHEDDHHRRHQDFGAGRPGRRRARRCGRSIRRSAWPSRGPGPGVPAGRGMHRAAAAGRPRPAATWRRCTQQLSEHGGHRRQRRAARRPTRAASPSSTCPTSRATARDVFQAVAAGGIVVDMIVQNLTGRPAGAVVQRAAAPTSSGRCELTREAATAIDPAARGRRRRRHRQAASCSASACGRTPAWPGGCSARWPSAASTSSMINTSEVRVSVVVDRARGEEACDCLREVFLLPADANEPPRASTPTLSQEHPNVPPPHPPAGPGDRRSPACPAIPAAPGPEAPATSRPTGRSSAAPSATTSRPTRACSRSGPRAAPKLVWKGEGVGEGFSSVAVVGDKVFTMGDKDGTSHVFALDRANGQAAVVRQGRQGGRQLHRHALHADGGRQAASTPSASSATWFASTPAKGEEKWRKNFGKDFGGRAGRLELHRIAPGRWRPARLHAGRAQGDDGRPGQATGEEIWRSRRATRPAIRRSSSPTRRASSNTCS